MDTTTILLSITGAFIGTFGGAFLINQIQKNKTKSIRKIACKGLKVFEKYAKGSNTYDNANADFNATLNIAEKRAVLVSLHKLGVPIETPIDIGFDIKSIRFFNQAINNEELKAMAIQIKKGHCDHLFFMDVDTYFKENIKAKALRNIGKKFVNEVLCKSTYDNQQNMLINPERWEDKFSYSEFRLSFVFRMQIGYTYHFFDQQTGKPNNEKLNQLLKEIDNGLWDGYLDWDYNAYLNMITQKESAEIVKKVYEKSLDQNQNKQNTTDYSDKLER